MRWSTPARRSLTACLVAGALAHGCGRSPETPDPALTKAGETRRIVSLSPAVSRTLVDYGLEDRIVGRTAWCASLDPAIPVVGDLYELDYERLIRLDPTHVLIQPPSTRGVDPQLQRLAQEHGWTLNAWTISSLEDVQQMIRDLPGTLYDEGDPRWSEAHQQTSGLIMRLAMALSPGGETLWQGRTLLVADTDPVWVFGRDTYLDDMLAALGGTNASDARGWAELSLEDVLRLDPQAIIIVRDREPRDLDVTEAAGVLATLDTTARDTGRIAVLWHADAKLPSSGLIGVAETLRRVLVELAGAGT